MIFFAVLCIGIGVAPQPLYALLSFGVDYVPYTASHVVFYLQLLLFSGLAFFLMLGWLKRTLTITLDVDWLYRALGRRLAMSFGQATDAAWGAFVQVADANARGLVRTTRNLHGPNGVLGRSLSTGTMVFWTTVMLAAWLLASYL